MSTTEARGAVEAVWRMESARIVGALARYTGDFSLAEDIAQEALAEAERCIQCAKPQQLRAALVYMIGNSFQTSL